MTRKLSIVLLSSILTMFMLSNHKILAEDFAGNEEYWQHKCSVAQSSQEGRAQCEQFRKYYEDKRSSLNQELSSMTQNIATLKDNIANLSELAKKTDKQLEFYTDMIASNDANIRIIESEINILNNTIIEKQNAIDKRAELIKRRMKSEQYTLGTAVNIEILMGADDIVDMIRKINGIQKITDSDQNEIDLIQKEKQKLSLDKREKKRLKDDAETKKAENIKNKEVVETLKSQQETMISIYHQQEAQLTEKMRNVHVSIASLGDKIIQISDPGSVDMGGASGGFIRPVQAGYQSAGTWYYPGGGVHLGMDFAASIGTPVYAPANAIILYANNPLGSNTGFYPNLGSGSGYPAGGGNTIHLLTQVNGTTYAISFFHLAKEGFMVRAGATVTQGQQIALTGNTGNTTGPHCHVEVFNLGSMSIASAISRFQSTADFSWNTGWFEQALRNTCEVKGPPCRQKPETIF